MESVICERQGITLGSCNVVQSELDATSNKQLLPANSFGRLSLATALQCCGVGLTGSQDPPKTKKEHPVNCCNTVRAMKSSNPNGGLRSLATHVMVFVLEGQLLTGSYHVPAAGPKFHMFDQRSKAWCLPSSHCATSHYLDLFDWVELSQKLSWDGTSTKSRPT